MSIKGSPHARFRRSLETGRLSVVLLAAAELQHLELDDALEVLVLMARERHPRFDRAAARWVGRLPALSRTLSAPGLEQYRHGDSNPGFRRERAAS